jgi:hypothetical protein
MSTAGSPAHAVRPAVSHVRHEEIRKGTSGGYNAGPHQSKTADTNPSASFGSNQVDLGGITWFASATAIRSCSEVG